MRKFLTGLIVVFVLVLSIFVQINLLNILPLWGVAANLGIIIIVGLGLTSGTLIGGLTGAFYGLMLDIVFSKMIGINVLLYTIVGMIMGRISPRFSKDNKTAMVMIVVITTIIFEITSYLLISCLQASVIKPISMIIIVLIEAVYNLLLTGILHKMIIGLGEMINKAKNSYYLL